MSSPWSDTYVNGRTAIVTFQATSWSGWSRDHYPIVTYAKLRIEKGTALNAATLGFPRSETDTSSLSAYEVLVERIVVDRVQFAFRNLTETQAAGTINLSGPTTGRFILRAGDSKELATPTMDAGIIVKVTLEEIR